ncbi:GNAT family N-acetyltransferase [Halobacillus yeomjeoni]|uniref:GNAT family N-acetyltransferase n=1 Tax=Halobacillus yeomjeoni TaxID=311194 RepID=A0A931MUJ4_9BACI|nr:GNAT family N-acetyltransferase [Halobacillus yeomjeoni]MBH0229441.1 GNAT family N-acetyltransferase [Halobacillus yeomjeoni]
MDERLQLIKPTIDLKDEYISFYNEWKETGESMVPWVIEKDPGNFEAMVQFLEDNANGVNLPEGWIPHSTYWLIDQNNKVLGVVNLRHELTDFLRNNGGHIGYGIRPSERKKGYATQLLALSLEKAKALYIKKVLVVCDEWNTASYKTIVNNSGVADTDFVEEDGNVVKRFWIAI